MTFFSRAETETRRWYVSRPSRDRDVETETTTLVLGLNRSVLEVWKADVVYIHAVGRLSDEELSAVLRVAQTTRVVVEVFDQSTHQLKALVECWLSTRVLVCALGRLEDIII